MSRLDQFRSAVREAVGDQPLASTATAAGLPRDAIRSVLTGHDPRLSRVFQLADALGLEFYIGPPREDEISRSINQQIDDLLSPERELLHEFKMFRKEILELLEALSRSRSANLHSSDVVANQMSGEGGTAQPDEEEVVRFSAWRQVDQIDLAVAAGSGAEADDESVTERLTFRLDWLRSHGLDPAQCTVVKVQGESMEPSLPEGSAILVDRARKRRRAGGIFVVRTADGVVVKRLGKDDAGGWQLLSDHPAWDSVTWPQDAKVIGEVKWMARTL